MNKPISAFNYFGGKNALKLQRFILDNLKKSPVQFHLVDLFCGSAAIALNYTESSSRTINDLNDDIYNFFRQLRDNPDALITAIELTPHCRKEYESLNLFSITDPIEKARAFFIRTVCSFGNTGALKKYNAWSYTVNDSRYKVSQSVARLLSKVENLTGVVEQLRHIQIECKDYKTIISKYDSASTLFYVDPPYVKITRSGNISYKHELTNSEQIELCNILNSIQGKYLLSGYANDFYESHLKYQSKKSINNIQTNAHKRAEETVWANYQL